jgi:hypothetical protein
VGCVAYKAEALGLALVIRHHLQWNIGDEKLSVIGGPPGTTINYYRSTSNQQHSFNTKKRN